MNRRKYLITGGCGFVGSNIASEVIRQEHDLVIFDSLSRFGATENLTWLRTLGSFKFVHGDIRNRGDVEELMQKEQPDVVFHLAGQVAMTTSIQRPYHDFEVNALGSLNVLEAVRKYQPDAVVVYSSTNKVYGDLEYLEYQETESRYVCTDFPAGFGSRLSLDFHSPYGCSKGAADQYMLDYHRMFKLRTIVFRHSSMYGGRQFATYDQGWVGWFCRQAVETKLNPRHEFTISGSGKQVRDLLHADDVKRLYMGAIEEVDSLEGKAFNIGGGMPSSMSLLELFGHLESLAGVKMNFVHKQWRESDQRVFVADLSELNEHMRFEPSVAPSEGIPMMFEWISSGSDPQRIDS